MNFAIRLAAVTLAGSLLTGCGLLVSQLATEFSLDVVPDEVSIASGSTEAVRISIGRTLPVDVVPAPILVTLHNPPEGVSAPELTIPSGVNEDDLMVQVASGTEAQGPLEVTVRATNGIKTREDSFQLTITAP